MPQQPHFVAAAMPADITNGLPAGRYVAQLRGDPAADFVPLVEYATAAEAPDDARDFLQCAAGAAFVFEAGPACLPTWVRVAAATADAFGDGFRLAVALARLGPA